MKSFKVSNFRLFGSEGAEVEFKPVTVLTGANSSGKSSFVKALALFGDYLSGILNAYRRDGGYDPVKHELDFSDPKLQLESFSKTINRSADSEELMSFTLEVNPKVSCLGGYKVTYSFDGNYENDTLGHGFLKEISLSRKNDIILYARRNEKWGLEAMTLNNSSVLVDFWVFLKYCLLPNYVLELGQDYETGGEWHDDYCDENGKLSPAKVTTTKLGARLAKIQGEECAVFDYTSLIKRLPTSAFEKYKKLFRCNMNHLFDALEVSSENNLIFFFPVLDYFKEKTKEESIRILREKAHIAISLESIIYKSAEHFAKDIESIIQDFESSDYDSFIDYYRSLEDYVLENINSRAASIGRWGESFNFIEDHIIHRMEVAYDNIGFSRRDESETLFSTVYSVLSEWQWAEDESRDTEWFSQNASGIAISSLWGEDNSLIQRSIAWEESPYYSSSHILYNAYKDFLCFILSDCLILDDLSRFYYNSGSFTSVQRLHTYEEDSVFTNVIKQYLEGRTYLLKYEEENRFIVGKEKRYIPDSFLNKWISKLKICDRLEFEVPLGLGFSLNLLHDGYKEQLADVGHGITQIVIILLQIESALIENEILDIKRAQKQDTILPPIKIIGLEEPEVSLHPCFQSLLADMLYDAILSARDENNNDRLSFIVETHSEYLIRKLQVIVSRFTEKEFKKNPFTVYYFENNGMPKDLVFMESGRFKESFGPGFFDEAAHSRYLLTIPKDDKEV